jgi:hypothetical protein
MQYLSMADLSSTIRGSKNGAIEPTRELRESMMLVAVWVTSLFLHLSMVDPLFTTTSPHEGAIERARNSAQRRFPLAAYHALIYD